MKVFVLSLALLVPAAASAQDAFHRSSVNGVQVYRGVPAQPDVAGVLRMRELRAAQARANETMELRAREVAAREREADALEQLAERLERPAPAPAISGYVPRGQFFAGSFTNFPLIPSQSASGVFRRPGIAGLRAK